MSLTEPSRQLTTWESSGVFCVPLLKDTLNWCMPSLPLIPLIKSQLYSQTWGHLLGPSSLYQVDLRDHFPSPIGTSVKSTQFNTPNTFMFNILGTPYSILTNTKYFLTVSLDLLLCQHTFGIWHSLQVRDHSCISPHLILPKTVTFQMEKRKVWWSYLSFHTVWKWESYFKGQILWSPNPSFSITQWHHMLFSNNYLNSMLMLNVCWWWSNSEKSKITVHGIG